MKAYPSIADHGLIGDLQTSALVATDGSVDWFCSPRIDSPSIFGSLLDQERGGHFRISPHRSRYTTKQLYFPDTAILITRFLTEHGVGEVMDFMPIATGRAPTDNHRLVRLLRCVRGKLTFDVDIAPRFDYGRQPHEARVTEGGFEFQSKDMRLAVHPVREPADQILATTEIVDGDVHAQVTLEAGMVRGLVLESAPAGPPHPIPVAEIERLLDDTAAFWRAWLSRCQYTGRWREMVARSAITLKLMTYAPSRRARGRPHRRAARAGRRRTQLGLPLHLDPRRLLLASTRCWGWASPRKPPPSPAGWESASRRRPPRGDAP